MDRHLGILGWSQAYLARKLGVAASTVTRWRRSGLPLTVERYLEAMVKLKEVRDMAAMEVDRPKGRPRGASVARASGWEPSATDTAQQQPGADYVRKVDEWQDADLDQDSGEYNRG